MKVGVCGTGAFANSFIPLFKAHPLVEEVILSDLDAEKLAAKSQKFDIPKTVPSLDDLCESDIDAIAIFTQPDRHGLQSAQALKAGKHVYSAAAIPNLIYLAVDKADVCKKRLNIYRSDLESALHLGEKRQGVRNVLDY